MLELICHTVQDGCQISVSGDAGIDPLCERLKKKKKKEKKKSLHQDIEAHRNHWQGSHHCP